MTQIGETREAKMQITGITGVQDREGRPQWEFKARFEWTPERSTYGDTMYVYRDKFSDWGVDTKGEVWVEVMAAEIKPQSAKYQADTGETHFRGDRDWHWKWVAIKTLDREPAPLPTPTFSTNGGGGGGSDQVEYRRSKELMNWIEALKIAARLYSKEYTPAPGASIDYARIRSIAMDIYAEITTGPPQEEPEPVWSDPRDGPDGSETPVEVLVASEPQRTTAPPPTRPQRPPPKSSDAKLKQLNQARYDKDGTEVYSGDNVVQHIATNYSERGPRDLVDAEIDEVIEALIAGQVKAAKVANDTALF